MKLWIPLAAVILALSACQEPAPTVDPANDVPAKTPDAAEITFTGFGPAAFGADPEQVRAAWRMTDSRDLEAMPPEPAACYYLMPQPLPPGGYRIAFMIEGGVFARIDVKAADIAAPGGGKVRMSTEEIEALYPGRIEERPHKYVEGAKYLRITDEAGGEGVLIFDTGANGTVNEWRIGVPPQVDYVEGCS